MIENTPYLIVGLGNPGPKYHNNRHNVGFMVADALGDRANIPIRRFEFRALIGKGDYADARLILAKPQTYMNNSGQAVSALVNFYKIPTEKILVIHDDLDLPFGTLRMRPQGSAGGQRGVGSIIAKLNTQNFARLRVGISRPPGRMRRSPTAMVPRSGRSRPLRCLTRVVLPEPLAPRRPRHSPLRTSRFTPLRTFRSQGVPEA